MANSFWSSIDTDTKSGAATVLVKDEHLKDFPAFMNQILQNKIGLDVGFFKIRFEDEVQFQTSLEELTTYIHKYYKPSQLGKRRKEYSPSIAIQGFFRGGSCQEWFGYRDLAQLPIKISMDTFIAKDMAKFLDSASDPLGFKTQATCCLELLCTDEDTLVDHYYDFITSISLDDHSSSEVIEGILLNASKVRHKYVKMKPQVEQSEPNSSANHFIMYGTGIPVKDAKFPVTSNFNLSKLGTILDANQEKIPGISHPYLDVGSTHASFPWHIKDQALFSINIVHFGAPCVWLIVPPKFYTKFVQWARFMPLDKFHVMCSNVLGHKYLIASKKCLAKLGIPVTTVIQKEKEIIITYPYAGQSGWKLGSNIQMAANFADDWWIEAGIFAPSCHCFPTQVALDLKEIIAVGRASLLDLYLQNDTIGLMQAVAKNPFIRLLNLFPAVLHVEKAMVSTVHTQTVEEKETEGSGDIPNSISADYTMEAKSQSTDENTECHKTADEMDMKSASNRRLLICPHGRCAVSYEGGVGKVDRLMNHIDSQHSGCCECVEIVKLTYPKRQLKEGTRIACHVCGKLLAGSVTHLNEHIKRVHNK